MGIIIRGHGDDALGGLRKWGATDIEFWCVGGRVHGRACFHRETVPIDQLIERVGSNMTLVMLARRSRCRNCRRVGCHVQAVTSIGYGKPEWVRGKLIGDMIYTVKAANDAGER